MELDYCIKSVANAVTLSRDGGRAVASTATLDRHDEIILPSAFAKRIGAYLRNPVLLAAHTNVTWSGAPSVIGRAADLRLTDLDLSFLPEFAPTTNGNDWKILYEGGFASAFSVGIIPFAGEYRKIKKGEGKRTVYVYTDVELVEISAVPVGANPDALMQSFGSKSLKRFIDDRIEAAFEQYAMRRMTSLFERH